MSPRMPSDKAPEQRLIALGDGQWVPYPRPGDAAATAVGKGNRRADTKPEAVLRSALHRAGLRFRKDHPIRPDERRLIRVDIAFSRAKLAVFVDGCFWHMCPEHSTSPRTNTDYWLPKLRRNVARDRETDVRLCAAGWEVLRFWEHTPAPEAVEDTVRALERLKAR